MSTNKGTIHEELINSKVLNEPMPIYMYEPPNFKKENGFSLLIVQDMKDYLQFGRLARFADELISTDAISQVVIVGTHYKNVEDRRNKYHPSGNEHIYFTRFLTEELIPWLDDRYPSGQFLKERTIMGDSLAGTVALTTAIRYPEVFSRVILHSAYINEEIIKQVKQYSSPKKLDIYQVIGKDEKVVEISNNNDFLTPNRQIRQLFLEKEFHLFYDEFDGGHSWKYWQPDLKRTLQQMFG